MKLPRIDSVAMQFRSDESFKGIVEAFKRTESKGGKIILRTDPQQRAGLYFTVHFDHSVNLLPQDAKFKLYFITNLKPSVEVVTWEFHKGKSAPFLQNEVYLGITDNGNYNANTRLIAWKVELCRSDETIIAQKQSFAW